MLHLLLAVHRGGGDDPRDGMRRLSRRVWRRSDGRSDRLQRRRRVALDDGARGIEVRASLDDRASTRHRGPAILFRYEPAAVPPAATTTIPVPPGTRGGDVIHARVEGREISVTVPSPPPMKIDVAVPPPSAPQVGASYQPLQAPYVPKAPYHQQAPPPAMATELKASEAVPVGPPSARNQQRVHRADDVNDLEAPGRPPTPPWRARAPARNMSVAGVSGIN